MQIIVANSIHVIDFISPFLITDFDCPDNEVFKDRLRYMLTMDRENLFIPTAWETLKDKEEPQLQAFMVAVTADGFTHVVVSQAWARPDSEPRLMDLLYHRVVMWARNKGKTNLMMETRRDPRAFTRRWGFEQISVTMEKRIDQEYEAQLVKKLTHGELIEDKKEVLDGQVKQATDSQRIQLEPEADRPVVEPVTAAEVGVRSGSDTIHRADSPEPDAPVSELSKLLAGLQSKSVQPADKSSSSESA